MSMFERFKGVIFNAGVNDDYIRELQAQVAAAHAVMAEYREEIDSKTNEIGRLRSALWKVKQDRNDWRQRFNDAKARARRGKF